MALGMAVRCLGNNPVHRLLKDIFLLLCIVTGALSYQVLVPERVTAVLGNNITLGCRVEADAYLTQISWERRLPSGPITLAVFNPEYGTSVSSAYEKRLSFCLSFRSASVHDATIMLEDVGFSDIGVYTCKVSTFPLGNMQASTTVSVLEPPPTTPTPAFTAVASTSPKLASLSDCSLGTVVGLVVGGFLFLVLLLVLGGACYRRQRHTCRGDYYTKQYLDPADMQKEPHELQEVYGRGGDPGKGSQDLNPKPSGGMISPDKDHPKGLLAHAPTTMNHSTPYLPGDCYENGSEGDYVFHVDGSVISRREWYL